MRRGFLLLGILMLAACSGGGGSSAAPPPTGTTPVPGATATPTPSAGVSSAPSAIPIPGPTVGAPTTPTPTASPVPPATPSPTPSPVPSPVMAIGYGGNPPQTVAFFNVGQTVPTRTMTVNGCCFWQLLFDPQGDLLMADDTKVSVFAPGASTPFKTLPQGGFSMALSAQGDIAVGGYNMGSTVAVYPGGSASAVYRVPGQPAFQSLAFSPAGELAVPQSNGTVRTFPRGSTAANRTFAVNGIAPSGVNFIRVAYDHAGNLAMSVWPLSSISVYAPGSTTAAYSITGFHEVDSFAFDPSNRLVVADLANGIKVYSPGSTTPAQTITGADAYVLAVDSRGDIPFGSSNGTSGAVLANGTIVPIGSFSHTFTVATYP